MNKHCRGCIRYLKSCSGLSKAVCEKHQLRIPRTNADRLRAMSDEELAEWIISITEDDTEGWLDWLKQEAKNEL